MISPHHSHPTNRVRPSDSYSFGRFVLTVANYEPTAEYSYDTFGKRVATTRLADNQWRKNETISSFVLSDATVWLTQTNIVSCSDSAIAPLVTSFALQLTGLTAALPARSHSFDIRGNVTENEMVVDSAIVTSRQTVPYAANKPLALSRYGVSLMDVSVSAVTNTVAYDSLGRQISNTDGRGNTRQTEYNSLGQRSATIDALGNRTSYAYDPFGNLASVTDPLGHVIVYEYDLRGNMVLEYGATYPVRYTYDIFGNKTSMTTFREGFVSDASASGDTTTWLYDIASGSMTNKVYADGKGPSYTYTPNGRLSRRTWARGIVTDYSYDNWGSLTNTVYSDNTPMVSLAYDALGRQTEAYDAAGITTLLYDSFGALTNETVIGTAGTNTIIRHWDNYGRSQGYSLVGLAAPCQPQRQSTVAYDPTTGRLASMLAAGSETPFAWSYLDGSDLKSSLAYPNGLTASWQYDANNQLLQACNAFPTNIISQHDYTYDAADRRVQITRSGSAMSETRTDTYGYNARSELISASKLGGPASGPAVTEYAYSYDDIGNRITSLDLGTNRTYTANNLNQYTLVGRGDHTAPQEEFIPQFDDDGNQTLIKTSTGIWQVQYNGENRPILWECITPDSNTQNSSTPPLISMSYDRMGRRVTKNNQRFVYDGYLQIANFELQTSNIKLQTFIWDPTEPVATRPLVWNLSTFQPFNFSTSYYTHDGNKNVSEVVEENGDIAAHYEYTPFGALTTSRGMSAAANPWRFSSEYAEANTALVYYNYRHYEPSVGIWLSRDPYKEEEDTFFVNNDPIGLLDWLGLDWERSTCVSISHSKNFDFRNKPLGRIGPVKFNGTLAFGYSLKGEACLRCCKTGGNAGVKKWEGSGAVSISGEGSITATLGVDFKTGLFWDLYKLYLFGGVQASLTLAGSGTGAFEFDGCEKSGTLNASLSDSLEFAFRLGVEGYLKRRGSRRKGGNWHYNNIARVAALATGTVSTSLETSLACNTEKCILKSSYGGVEINAGVEFTFWREKLTFDLWRFKRDGYVIAEMEFESPLKGWVE